MATSLSSFAATRSLSLSSSSTTEMANTELLVAPKICGAALALVESSCFGAKQVSVPGGRAV